MIQGHTAGARGTEQPLWVQALTNKLSAEALDDYAAAAAGICDAPVGLITVLAGDQQYFVGRSGTTQDATDVATAICAHAVASGQTLVGPDARRDPRFRTFPSVSGAMAVRFYAGAPLTGPDGREIGTVCVVDSRPRTLGPAQIRGLEALARQLARALRPAPTVSPNRAPLDDASDTVLTNRRSLRDLLALPPLAGTDVALFVIDVDRMKAINLALGRDRGDEILSVLARRLREAAHLGDVASQIGGDEFALLCPHSTDPLPVADHGRAIAAALSRPVRNDVNVVDVSVSVGASAGTLDQSERLLHQAGLAARQAKVHGTGRFVHFTADHRFHDAAGRARNPVSTRSALRRALDRDELELHYQPIIRLGESPADCPVGPVSADRVAGYEALLRWRDPTRGLLAPDQFLSAVEGTALMVAVGTWVLKRALTDAARVFEPNIGINVNVAPVQLAQPGFAELVCDMLDAASLAPERLGLEITETTILDATPGVLLATARLAECGVRIALDDFGTGYSSLASLDALPISEVKIDRSFTAQMSVSPSKAKLVNGIIRLAEANDALVVAEGVEHADQARMLQAYGCTLAQGHLYGSAAALSWPCIQDR